MLKIRDQETKEKLYIKQIQIRDCKTLKIMASTENTGGEIRTIEKTKDGYCVKGLPVGEYELEIIVPDGYKQIEKQLLKIEDTRDWQTEQIENRKLEFDMGITKRVGEIRVNGRKLSQKALKVEVKSKNIKIEDVEFEYVIEVKNEGELGGKVGKIIDKIPNGLEYVEKEKGIWEVNGSIAECNLYKDKKLGIGESLQLKITLKWKNSESNFGEKTNIATLEGSSNEFGYPNKATMGSEKGEVLSSASVLIGLQTGKKKKIVAIIILLLITILISIATVMTRRNLKIKEQQWHD